MRASTCEHGALLDANYQTTKLSKINALDLGLQPCVKGTLPASSRAFPGNWKRPVDGERGGKIPTSISLVNRASRHFSNFFLKRPGDFAAHTLSQ